MFVFFAPNFEMLLDLVHDTFLPLMLPKPLLLAVMLLKATDPTSHMPPFTEVQNLNAARTYIHTHTHGEEQQETVQLLLSTGRTNRRFLAILTVHPASFTSRRHCVCLCHLVTFLKLFIRILLVKTS